MFVGPSCKLQQNIPATVTLRFLYYRELGLIFDEVTGKTRDNDHRRPSWLISVSLSLGLLLWRQIPAADLCITVTVVMDVPTIQSHLDIQIFRCRICCSSWVKVSLLFFYHNGKKKAKYSMPKLRSEDSLTVFGITWHFRRNMEFSQQFPSKIWEYFRLPGISLLPGV